MAPEDSMPSALARHGIELPEDQVEALDRYCRALWSWNEKINLTRHTDYEKFVSRDVVDSQHLEEFIEAGETVLDVGTGGGVPGVILAILRPDIRVELCESIGKKAKAVSEIVKESGLKLPVHHARAEQLLENRIYDTLVVRAVAPLAKLLTWFAPHWDAFRRLLVIKGPAWVEERGEARHRGLMHGMQLRRLASYPLPGTESESVILQLQPEPAE